MAKSFSVNFDLRIGDCFNEWRHRKWPRASLCFLKFYDLVLVERNSETFSIQIFLVYVHYLNWHFPSGLCWFIARDYKQLWNLVLNPKKQQTYGLYPIILPDFFPAIQSSKQNWSAGLQVLVFLNLTEFWPPIRHHTGNWDRATKREIRILLLQYIRWKPSTQMNETLDSK